MSEVEELKIKLEREDAPTKSIWQRWKYELFVKHLKKTLIVLIILVVVYGGCFYITVQIVGTEKWAMGFAGIFICPYYAIKWVFIGLWFVISRAWTVFLFSPIIYLFINYFIKADRIGFRELGGTNTYFFKITTTAEGYLLHEDKLFGLLKKPVFLDKATLQYFKEHGIERASKEKGKRDDSYREIDIVPLSWRGDSLLITDEESGKKFINSGILVNEKIRDYYAYVVKGFSPADRELEKSVMYDEILGTSNLKKQVIQLRREVKEMDIEHIEKVAEVVIPHSSDELRRFKGILKETTKDYNRIAEKIEEKTAMLELVKQESNKKKLTNKEIAQLVAIKELE